MLRRTPSLALRAVLTFTAVYVAALAAFLAIVTVTDTSRSNPNRHTGARIAVSAAWQDLAQGGGVLRLPGDGGFANLANRNPAIWLLARRGDETLSFGTVPEPVRRTFDRPELQIESGRFYVPGAERPLANTVIERLPMGDGSILLAAGGVDPRTIGRHDSIGASWGEGVAAILAWVAIVGFVAMLIALPILSRALKPLAAEAASIRPQEPGRRLGEAKAPRELLPLVRGFNAALDRLASELGRRKRFIADAAHELRTPLAVVALRVEALEDESARDELRRGVGRLTHLVGQMLDLERLSLSAGRGRPVDLVAVARDVIADLAPMALKEGYEISLDAPDEPVMVTADEHAVARALTNLIGNSVAHGGGSGQIGVTVRSDRTVDVADEGPGIPQSLLPHLFEPFSRGSAVGEGCGLGLHLTREIMRAHGGEVSLLPGPIGATFRLSFGAPDSET